MKEESTSQEIGDFTVARYFAFVEGSDCDRAIIIKKVNTYLTKKGHSVAIIKHVKDLELFQEISTQKIMGYEDLKSKLIAYVSPEVSNAVHYGPDQEALIFQLAEDTTDYILLDGFENLPDTPKAMILGTKEPGEYRGFDTVAVIGTHEKARIHPLYKTESELPTLVETLALPPNHNLNCGKCGFPNCKAFRAMVLKGKKGISDCVTYGSPVRLCVNDKNIALVPFIQRLIDSIVTGMVHTLQIPDEAIRTIQITIKKPQKT
ncbi:MAG: (Fe-S)-binding protein [Candidatus Heimdallarchaeota archaeon]